MLLTAHFCICRRFLTAAITQGKLLGLILSVFARQAENMFKLCVLVCLFPLHWRSPCTSWSGLVLVDLQSLSNKHKTCQRVLLSIPWPLCPREPLASTGASGIWSAPRAAPRVTRGASCVSVRPGGWQRRRSVTSRGSCSSSKSELMLFALPELKNTHQILVLCPACLSLALQATQSVNDTVPPFCPSSLWDQHVSIPASVLLLLFITTSLQVPDCPTREVLMLKAEKCQFENYNFSTPWSVEGAPPFAKAVIPLPLFVKALYQLLLFKDTCKDGMCLSFKTLAKWVELSLKWCGLFPSQ